MKRIKLLTFSSANSFGAMMQCYALSKVLVALGYTVELLDIPLVQADYGFLGNVTSRIDTLFFDRFRKNRLYKQVSLLDNRINSDDIYLVGSDQVWNPSLTKDKALSYFFNFLPDEVKRISYAASFGNTNWEKKDIESEVRSCLQKFSAIGVREDTGVKICRDVFQIDATLTLDPTLLLSNYDELVSPENSSKPSLVFFSLLRTTPEMLQFVCFMGKQVHAHPVMLAKRRPHFGVTSIPWLTVDKWVSRIAGSSFVITDSFHGTVFAILFKKQFIVLPAHSERVGRILNLLQLLGLNDRYYPDIESVRKTTDWAQLIDYKGVFEKLDALRQNSMIFLESALKS